MEKIQTKIPTNQKQQVEQWCLRNRNLILLIRTPILKRYSYLSVH